MIRVWFSSGQYAASTHDNVLDAVASAITNPMTLGHVVAVTHDEDPMVTAVALGFR
ncbi:hypothetical protein [Methylibium petroleiphilum]|uniref:hypothetical protein n=1 Tax=Methylibium petroleiphilum TaxID=105560 RepID=UPI000404FB47|nr:hypothetical protein [Methylibium petroleiphilum]